MKLLIALCFTAALFAADGPQQAKNDDQTKAKAQAPADSPEKPLTEIPAGAVQFEPGSYHYTDAKGKKWILRPTPFGIAKIEDTGVPAKKYEDHSLDNAKVTEDGDSVKFERPGPFGMYKWEKKKADLDPGEKAAWEREKAKTSAAPNQKTSSTQDQKK
jgi:hypothetical protein